MVLLPSLSLIFLAGGTYASFHDFGIPASSATVDVRVFNVGNANLTNTTHAFVAPVLPGHETITFPMFAFLVEHKKTQTRLMFDLGMRKDVWNFVPTVASYFGPSGFMHVDSPKDITEQLQDGGISLASIDTVIWSHTHYDHIDSPTASLQASDFAGHNVTKVDFAASKLTFSGLKAVDYFGDGSFYLLDTPGIPGSGLLT
ncbi:hypothetical protein C8R44DRAFT_922188 [Mycena epipterygia]|nr:hypothetical protein C8R44DRAFT_922188 [Mycena epipterygia]